MKYLILLFLLSYSLAESGIVNNVVQKTYVDNKFNELNNKQYGFEVLIGPNYDWDILHKVVPIDFTVFPQAVLLQPYYPSSLEKHGFAATVTGMDHNNLFYSIQRVDSNQTKWSGVLKLYIYIIWP